jgi:hypothetical protein
MNKTLHFTLYKNSFIQTIWSSDYSPFASQAAKQR